MDLGHIDLSLNYIYYVCSLDFYLKSVILNRTYRVPLESLLTRLFYLLKVSALDNWCVRMLAACLFIVGSRSTMWSPRLRTLNKNFKTEATDPTLITHACLWREQKNNSQKATATLLAR